jgi:hypothetical protein
MKRILAALALFLTASIAYAGAGSENPRGLFNDLGTIQTAVALNGSQSAKTTGTISTAGYSVLRLTYNVTWVALSDFKIFCETTDTPSTSASWHALDPIDSAGAVQVGQPIYTRSGITGSFIWTVRIGVAGLANVRCYPTATSAGASDLMTTRGVLFQ